LTVALFQGKGISDTKEIKRPFKAFLE